MVAWWKLSKFNFVRRIRKIHGTSFAINLIWSHMHSGSDVPVAQILNFPFTCFRQQSHMHNPPRLLRRPNAWKFSSQIRFFFLLPSVVRRMQRTLGFVCLLFIVLNTSVHVIHRLSHSPFAFQTHRDFTNGIAWTSLHKVVRWRKPNATHYRRCRTYRTHTITCTTWTRTFDSESEASNASKSTKWKIFEYSTRIV